MRRLSKLCGRSGLFIGLCAGCGAAGDRLPATGVSVTDSAGVAIINIAAQRVAEVPLTPVGDPVRTIATPTDGNFVLFRVISAVLLNDESVLAIANGGSSEVLLFDEQSKLHRRIGRKGNGPGEYLMPAMVWRRGDTLGVYDIRGPQAGRVDLYSGAELERSIPVRTEILGGGLLPLGSLADGTLLLKSDRTFFKGRQSQDSIIAYATAPDLSNPSPILEIPHTLSYGFEVAGQMQQGNVPLSPTAAVASGTTTFFVTDGAAFEIREYTRIGGHFRTIRIARRRTPIGRSHRDAYSDDVLRRFPAAAHDPSFQRLLQEVQYPDSLPAYDGLVVAGNGDIWASVFRVDGLEPREWHVINTEGGLVARLQLPADFRLTSVGVHNIAGVARDTVGAETVVIYRNPRGIGDG